MKRLSSLQAQLTGTESESKLSEEANRLGLLMKSMQTVEDPKRIMAEFKARANINGKLLAEYAMGESYPHFKEIVKYFETDPVFAYTELDLKTKPEQRGITNVLLVRLMKRFKMTRDRFINDPWYLTTLCTTTGEFMGPVGTKGTVHFALYTKSIGLLGTAKHSHLIDRALNFQDMGCFGLTEISHGSNVQGMITVAIFDEENQGFVINTPNELGGKTWIGNAAQTANMSIIAANLIVKGLDYGIHMFVVPIRNTNSHDLVPGVTILDNGDKLGLNGIDNGIIFFRNVFVPLDSLLDLVTQVAPDGTVTSTFPKKSQRFAVQIGGLGYGRVWCVYHACLSGIRSACIVLRYAAVRRQFGKEKNREMSIIEYPHFQSRMFPHYANHLITLFTARAINNLWNTNYSSILDPKNKQVKEMHALMSALKPISTWYAVRAVREAREAMGGNGMSLLSGIPSSLNDSNVIVTWEGDNNVLLQQTAKFLLSGVAKVFKGEESNYPSLKFLTMQPEQDYFPNGLAYADLGCSAVQRKLMAYRACKAVIASATALQNKMSRLDQFDSWNESMPFNLFDASIYYGELYIFDNALLNIEQCPDAANKEFLYKVLTIYSLIKITSSLEHLTEIFKRDHIEAAQELLLKTYAEIKYNIVKSFDDLVINDTYVGSVFGCEDGNIYGRYLSKLSAHQSKYGKPEGWRKAWLNRVTY